MKIALLGGVFDPPHMGHLWMARQMLDFCGVDEVWFLPNYSQSAPIKPATSVEHRLVMTKLLELPKTRVSTIEIDNKLDGETIHLLPFLPKEHEFSFVIGSDQLAGFSKWLDWEKLVSALPFWVFPRGGYPLEPLYNNMKAVAHESLVVSNLSSTTIRDRDRAGLSIAPFVPKAVGEYIKQQGLYR
ncbi:nicotinate (nicotinamide) nucleotide adenylyltransferase [Candidatus Gottesmanbacteria bacterium RIFCSPLOWO2_01_FULL_48_11]|uniref:Probable nicotinate-nucleotide adenylyltransferase n=2 Tax=Candidatus Gottesmaniibacteriota TaxID=1752720 RepID=A0A0G1UPB9_9BACT|nr:MAG: putative nicotinate-nucleotide adenylyltransferase [Candidatus Gottesmanbacteria bacterium GW2011_GWA1_48_13]OGG27791.1 MAG: nicotinate (nicotinamide) nucleotide adenylyltransferase [Candidatus Gottesmanbacteria bacterium RIFCSPLOWO2_01_FULL_48_11]